MGCLDCTGLALIALAIGGAIGSILGVFGSLWVLVTFFKAPAE
jgi:hypothetical protein